MTDREKLIELLETVPHAQRLYPDLYADHLITNGVTFQKWIPVTERLPEMPGKYLVTGRSFHDKIPQIWICECISVGLTIGWSNNVKNPIIEAWMPLPEPPKEDANET